MQFDTKQKILMSIYIEYQKDIPNMEGNIRHDKLGIDKEVFNIAIKKLQNENLIVGAHFVEGDDTILYIITDNIMMSREGIEYVETKIGLQHVLTGKEKLEFITKNAIGWGWEQAKDIAAKAIAELNKQ